MMNSEKRNKEPVNAELDDELLEQASGGYGSGPHMPSDIEAPPTAPGESGGEDIPLPLITPPSGRNFL